MKAETTFSAGVLSDIARRYASPRPEQFQAVYGKLNLVGTEHRLVWGLDRYFRPFDLFFWGHDPRTELHSFLLGNKEQFVGSFPPALALQSPMYPVESLLERLAHAPLEGGHLIGAKMKANERIERCNPSLVFDTGSIGHSMTLVATGALEHVVVLGASI